MGTPKAGSDIYLVIHDGVGAASTVACSRTVSLNLSADEIDTTNRESNKWHESLPSVRNWGVDCESLLIEDHASYAYLRNAYLTRTRLHAAVYMPSGVYYHGYGILSSLSISGPQDDAVTISASIKGMEALVRV